MPSTPAVGPKQIKLPSAPVYDRYGLHAEACECARCGTGFAPTHGDRMRARAAWERTEARKKREADRQAKGLGPTKTQARNAADEAATIETLKRMAAPVERPATPEELAELRRQFPALTRRKDPRR